MKKTYNCLGDGESCYYYMLLINLKNLYTKWKISKNKISLNNLMNKLEKICIDKRIED